MVRSVTITGLDELERSVKALTNVIQKDLWVPLLAAGDVLADSVRDKIVEQGLFDSGDLLSSVEAKKVSDNEVIVREGPLPYVFAQEYGLPNQVITDRQRRYFWARFSDTGDDMWKAMALSTTYTIPAKPHFRPGVMQAQHKAVRVMADEAMILLKRSAGG